jgi:hypothetical protein
VAVAICRWLVASLRRPNAGETEDNEERVFDMRKR